MKLMNMNLLDQRIKEKLGGNENRIVELFHEESFFNELVAAGKDGDWLHYEPKTFDGWYFIKFGNGFACYEQERGGKYTSMYFQNLIEAATYFYTKAGYIKPPKVTVFKKVFEKIRNLWFLYK